MKGLFIMGDPTRAKKILDMAKEAQKNSYAPYSNYHVGACLVALDDSNEEVYFSGCNVENAAYGSTICAERGAIMNAIVHGYKKFTDIAIVGETDHWAAPCGSCRQMLVEFNPNMNIIMGLNDGSILELPLKELLPMYFTSKELRGE